MNRPLPILLGIPGIVFLAGSAAATSVPSDQARRAAIHPVATRAEMAAWLSRVPRTSSFPDDVGTSLQAQSGTFVLEMTTHHDCMPCGDLWTKLGVIARRYGWTVRTIDGREAMIRSGRLGLPWVGHPVAWVRPADDAERAVPIAIGTDHEVNLVRNLYLAVKMLTGVRPAVGVRAMSKFTGIVGVTSSSSGQR